MKTVEEEVKKRHIPEFLRFNNGSAVQSVSDFEKRKSEIKELLAEYQYGSMPERPDHLRVTTVGENCRLCAGKATLRKFEFTLTYKDSVFSFPVFETMPNGAERSAAFVHINFRPDVPDKYMPSEEICDRGYAVFSFCYKDVTADDSDFRSGLAGHLISGRRKADDPGKLMIWAYAAITVMDYIETLDRIDKDNIAVIGHSRLGKAALLAGAFDERFKYIISNDSGASGAAISRGKSGERIQDITDRFPYWFSTRYKKFTGREEELPFDQHFLLALSVPRHVMIGSAELDAWADPESEFLSLALTNEAYRLYGMRGLLHDGHAPSAKAVLADGDALYQVRHGHHYFSREDWNTYMDFIDAKMKAEG